MHLAEILVLVMMSLLNCDGPYLRMHVINLDYGFQKNPQNKLKLLLYLLCFIKSHFHDGFLGLISGDEPSSLPGSTPQLRVKPAENFVGAFDAVRWGLP